MNQHQLLYETQKERFSSGETRSLSWRLSQLSAMERMLDENAQAIQSALYSDFRKPPFEQAVEIAVPLGVIRYFRENLERLMTPDEADLPPGLEQLGYKGRIHKEPFGVTLVIGPFPAPVLLLLEPAITALAAGNTVVLKPSNATPATADLLTELVPRYFSQDCVSLVTGGRDAITELLALPFDFIFFTGSTAVGKVVMKAAAENLTPVILELGGQNPTIVDETANLNAAARQIAWGHNAISGQWCVSPGYVCVHQQVASLFIEKLCSAIRDMYGDDPSQSPDFARMITRKDTERVASYIVAEKRVLGGRYDLEQNYVEPTVLYPSDWEDPAVQQEIFGPVLPVLDYDNLTDMLGEVSARPKPLAAYLFSTNQDNIDLFINTISFGGGCISQTNIHSWIDGLPFGGVGLSGMGRYYGEARFNALSNQKSMLHAPADRPLDIFPPYGDKDMQSTMKIFGEE